MGELIYKLTDGTSRKEAVDGDWDVLVRAAMHRQRIDSYAVLARALGVSRQTWHLWRSGQLQPRSVHWRKLADLAGFPGFQSQKAV